MNAASKWLVLAREDLEVAGITLREAIFNQTCFHAQQAAEKALKGFLAANDRAVPKTHVLGQLAVECTTIESDFQTLKADWLRLDRYYIPTRYPDALPGSLPEGLPDAKDAELALDAARRIFDFVAGKLGQE